VLDAIPTGAVVVVTGISAAGKSTVAELLARRFPRGVHVHGDGFRRMIVSGRHEMHPPVSDDALRQLSLRYELAALVADRYARDGFVAVLQDVIIGSALQEVVDRLEARPRYVVVLTPSAEAVAAREAARAKAGYGAESHTIDQLDAALRRETPQIGLWLDSSELTAEQTVEEILGRSNEARVAD
jgi:cytidylate kinase